MTFWEWALSALWPHAPTLSVLLSGTSVSLAFLFFLKYRTVTALVRTVSLLTNFLKVALSHYFLSHHSISSLPCTSKNTLVCFSVYLMPHEAFSLTRAGICSPVYFQHSQHLAQWWTLSMHSINICLMNTMNEEMYENTPNSCSTSSVTVQSFVIEPQCWHKRPYELK